MTQDNPQYHYTIRYQDIASDGSVTNRSRDVPGDDIARNPEGVRVYYDDENDPHFFLPDRHLVYVDRSDYTDEPESADERKEVPA